ncbi:hypothetical protein [Actinoplanes sp. NPDC051859]|uniref:hypothetical protein n=1 Tax=Actinoplanes sp. NPDC051859 TaxID=3363909 RepID=UPI00378AD401
MSRRLFAGLCAAGVVILGLTTPARAAAPEGTVEVALYHNALPVGGRVALSPSLQAQRSVTISNAMLTYELSGGTTGVSLVAPESENCTAASPTKVTCYQAATMKIPLPWSERAFPEVDLLADESVVSGSTVTVTAALMATGTPAVSATTDVPVVDYVDLAAGEHGEVSVEPGGVFTASYEVTNAGGRTVRGVGADFNPPPEFQSTERYRNCLYVGDALRGCLFDQIIEPAATYQLTVAYRLRKDTFAPSRVFGNMSWRTAALYTDFMKEDSAEGLELSTDPNGAVLALTPKVAALPATPEAAAQNSAGPQTDDRSGNDGQGTIVNVTGRQSADIAAVGAKVSGAVGATVQATVGVRNNGPAILIADGSGIATVLNVTIPAGSTVRTKPRGCDLFDRDGPQVEYRCRTGARFAVGESVTWTFGLRIDKVVTGAVGTVEANPKCECLNFGEDLDLSNNKAELVLDSVEATAPSSPTTSIPTTSSPATDAPTTGQPSQGTPTASAPAGVAVVNTGSAAPPRAAAPRAAAPHAAAPRGAGVVAVSGVRSALPNTGPDGMAVVRAGALFVAAGVAMVWLARRRTTSAQA